VWKAACRNHQGRAGDLRLLYSCRCPVVLAATTCWYIQTCQCGVCVCVCVCVCACVCVKRQPVGTNSLHSRVREGEVYAPAGEAQRAPEVFQEATVRVHLLQCCSGDTLHPPERRVCSAPRCRPRGGSVRPTGGSPACPSTSHPPAHPAGRMQRHSSGPLAQVHVEAKSATQLRMRM